jgi:hypothetical protein
LQECQRGIIELRCSRQGFLSSNSRCEGRCRPTEQSPPALLSPLRWGAPGLPTRGLSRRRVS